MRIYNIFGFMSLILTMAISSCNMTPTPTPNTAFFTLDVLYVSSSGNNSNSCRSPSTPCLTIAAAADKGGDADYVEVHVLTELHEAYPPRRELDDGTYLGIFTRNIKIINDSGLDPEFVELGDPSSGSVRELIIGEGVSVWLSGVYVPNPIVSGEGGKLTLQHSVVEGKWDESEDVLCGIKVQFGGELLLENSVIKQFQACGIENTGTTTIQGSEISDNRGPGIKNDGGRVELTNTTITRNTSNESGGILNRSGSVSIWSSVIFGNQATGAGAASGIFNYVGANVSMTNSTISSNRGGVGAVHNVGSLLFSYTTIADNEGFGLWWEGDGITQMLNSIILNNSGQDCYTLDYPARVVRGIVISDGSCNGGVGRFVDRPARDPTLAALGDNGGPTLTHALLDGSPAIDAAAAECPATDQRGVGRPVGAGCDAGAFEFSYALTASTPELPDSVTILTSTPEQAQVIATKNANCRYGPGTAYDIRDTLYENQTARVLGRNEANTWWQIELPVSLKLCWVSSVTVVMTGDVSGVQIVEVAPAPEAPPTEPPVAPQPPVQGCYVHDKAKGIDICVVPCPPNANPGGGCTP